MLWDGTTLYVASHQFVAGRCRGRVRLPEHPAPVQLRQRDRQTYTLLGSSQINNHKTETLVIDKDTSGQLWATWQQGNQIYLNNTGTDGSDLGNAVPHSPAGTVSWTTPPP